MEIEWIYINNRRIRAYKKIEKIFNDNKKMAEKIVYEILLDLELYRNIPDIVKFNGHKFYKTNINSIYQKTFKLIEI